LNEISINSLNTEIPEYSNSIVTFCNKVLNELSIDNWEVSLLFCDDNYIKELNKNYRNKDYPTDILSFPQGENINNNEKYLAGDIIISMNTLLKNADEYNVSAEEELKRLLIHGLLHLKGMEHNEEGCEMIRLQEKILEGFKKESIF
jgi:probable rRNA maturation factor